MTDFTVLLIGGPSGAGKTTLGRALATELGFEALSGDDLAMAGRALTTGDSHPSLHVMRGIGHVRYFTEGPPEKLISDAVALEDTMWPVVERVAQFRAATGAPAVVDWWLLPPDRAAGLGEGIASVFLHVDPELLWAWERSNTEWMAGSADPERMLANFMERSLWRNDLVRAEAERAGLPVLHVGASDSVASLVSRALAVLGAR